MPDRTEHDEYEELPRRRRDDDLSANEWRLFAAEKRLDGHDVKLDSMAAAINEVKADVKNIPSLISAEIAKTSETTIKWIVATSVSVGVLVVGILESLRVLH